MSKVIALLVALLGSYVLIPVAAAQMDGNMAPTVPTPATPGATPGATPATPPAGYVSGSPGAQDRTPLFAQPFGIAPDRDASKRCRLCLRCRTESCRKECWRRHCRE